MNWIQNLDGASALGIVLVVLLIAAGISWLLRRSRGGDVRRQTAPVAIAHIKEKTDVTFGGAFCFLMLILTQLAILVAYTFAATALQQAVIAALWIGGNTLWGIGVIVGRRKEYTVYRVEAAPPV